MTWPDDDRRWQWVALAKCYRERRHEEAAEVLGTVRQREFSLTDLSLLNDRELWALWTHLPADGWGLGVRTFVSWCLASRSRKKGEVVAADWRREGF